MQTGDMVRVRIDDGSCLGLLIQYHTWEKIATVLCDGELLRLHASQVQKAGKRDMALSGRRA